MIEHVISSLCGMSFVFASQASSATFPGSLLQSARFADFTCEFWRMSRTKFGDLTCMCVCVRHTPFLGVSF